MMNLLALTNDLINDKHQYNSTFEFTYYSQISKVMRPGPKGHGASRYAN